MVDSHKGDRPDQHAPAESKAVKAQDAQEARHAGAKDIATVEAGRTNASDGSARKRLKFVGDQDHSIEIESDGMIASRTSRLSEKDLLARSPIQKLEDFVEAATRRASNPEAYKKYLQDELEKTTGIGDGLKIAAGSTKETIVAAWKAINDGTVASILTHPGQASAVVVQAVAVIVDGTPKNEKAWEKALEHLGQVLLDSNDKYTHLSNREKGKVIGETMFGVATQEVNTAGGKELLKILREAGGHMDLNMLQTLRKSVTAAHELAQNTPQIAEQAKQMLFDFTSRMHLTGQELELAGIPEGWFAGMSPSRYGAFTEKFARLPESHIAPPPDFDQVQALKIQSQKEAVTLLIRAENAEPKITPLLQRLAKESGGIMDGLDHKLKSIESLTRKLETGKEADTIKDVLRYTMIFEDNHFTTQVKDVVDHLTRQGFELIKVKNTFSPGDIYKGLNCAFKLPDGAKFELQFHSPESMAIKQKNHVFYEAARELFREDPATGKDIMRAPEELCQVGHKHYEKLAGHQFLQILAVKLARAQEAVEVHAAMFKDALFEKMKQNYGNYTGPPGTHIFENFG